MTKKSRKALFYTSLLIFLIASPIVIMYSLGYKLDIQELKLQKTGGFFIKIDYKSYDIYINDKLKKGVEESIFSQQGVLIPNLIPKTYKVTIKKDGYIPWEKRLQVKSGLVTEIKNITLIPKNLQLKLIDKNVDDFILSDSKNQIAYKKENFLYIKNTESESNEIKKIKIPEENLSFFDFPNKNTLFLKNKDKIYKIDANTKNIYSINIPGNTKKIKVDSNNTNFVYILFENDLFKIDIQNNKKEKIAQKITNFYLTKDSIVYTTQFPANFYKKEKNSEKIQQLTFNPISKLSDDFKIIKNNSNPIGILNPNKNLLLFDYETERFINLANDIKDAKISDDGSKILYRKNNEIYIYYLSATYPKKEPKETVLIGRFSDKIEDASWLNDNNNYIFLKLSEKLILTEIDLRGQRNSYKIAEQVKKYIYSESQKAVYFTTKNNNLYKINLKIEK